MQKSLLSLLLLSLLAACQTAPQPQVTAASMATVTPTLPRPTITPTPTSHPQFLALQEQIAQSAGFTLNYDGQIEMQTPEGMVIIPGILISKEDGIMTVTHEGNEFEADPTTIKIEGQTLTFKSLDGKTWVWDGETLSEEIREFVPANTIEFTETLSNYDLKLAPDADVKAIYWDIAVSHLGDAISKSAGMEANRVIYEEIIKDHPEWEGIAHSWDYKVRVEFMKEFLTRSGGRMIVTDMNWNKYEADFNQPVKFEVIEVDELPKEYPEMAKLSQNEGRGGSGIMFADKNGQITYKLAFVPGCIEYYINIDPFRAHNNWGADWFVGEFFALVINSVPFHSNRYFSDPLASNYLLYIRGANKNEDITQNDGVLRPYKVRWSFVDLK